MGAVITMDPIAPILRAIPKLPYEALARLTERMIERLDEIDGDPDLEDTDLDVDPLEDREPEEGALPIYAIDQTRGPTNERAATADYLRQQEASA